MKRSFSLAIALSCSTLTWSQTQPPASTQQASPSGQLRLRGPEVTAQQDPNKVVATIEGNPITARQAADMLKDVTPEQRRAAPSLASLLQQIYMVHKFADQASQLHLDQQEPWKDELAATRANILGNAYLNHLASSNTSTAAPDPQQYYSSHPSEFEQIKLAGILVGFAPAGAAAQGSGVSRTEEQARSKAANLVKKLRSGVNFMTLAKTESDNKSSAAHDGELGTVTLGDSNLPPNIKNVLASLPAGQVSDPIQVQNGFYIFRVDSRTKIPFSQAREAITRKIQTDRNQAVLKQQFDKYKIQVNDPSFFSAGDGSHPIPSLQRPPSPGTPRPQSH